MAVDESANGAASQPGVPEQLFALQPNVGDWDVTADGRRFLVSMLLKRLSGPILSPIRKVRIWRDCILNVTDSP